MARNSLAPGNNTEQKSSETISEEINDTIEGFDISDILTLIEQEYNSTYSDQKKIFLDILKNLLLSGNDTFTSKVIESATNGSMPSKSISNYIHRLIHLGIVESFGMVDRHIKYRFRLQSIPDKSEKMLYTKNEIIEILSEFSSNTSENGKRINDIFWDLINDGKYSFTSEDIRSNVEVTLLHRKITRSSLMLREVKKKQCCPTGSQE